MTIQTTTAVLDLEHLQASDLHLDVIAHALAHLCRFGGHVSGFHSVAAHSVLVSLLVEDILSDLSPARRRQGAALGLLHDASEAYLGDVISPVKRLPQLAGYRELEAELQMLVWHRFGLSDAYCDTTLWVAVRAADERLCRVEQRDLQGVPLTDPHPPIVSRRPRDAKALFLARAMALGLE